MGQPIEFNWALKLSLSEIEEGKEYGFEKKGYRVYPIEIPIDMLNENWEAVARVIILETTHTKENTTGKYKVLKKYQGQEKEFLTEYWRGCVKHIKGDINDFSGVKVK